MSPDNKKLIRAAHGLLSLLALSLLAFFAATGLFLNHSGWFGLDEITLSKTEGAVPAGITKDKLLFVEELRARHGCRGGLESIDVGDSEVRAVFKAPARRSEAVCQLATGHLEVTHETRGLLARMAELHKGGDAGPAWSLVIDATALVCLASALTGLGLTLTVHKGRSVRLSLAGIGTAAVVILYFVAVP